MAIHLGQYRYNDLLRCVAVSYNLLRFAGWHCSRPNATDSRGDTSLYNKMPGDTSSDALLRMLPIYCMIFAPAYIPNKIIVTLKINSPIYTRKIPLLTTALFYNALKVQR